MDIDICNQRSYYVCQMSTAMQPLPLNQAVLLAADSIEARSQIPSVDEIARQAGVTRQYLYRLANEEIDRRQKEKGGCRQDNPPTTSCEPGPNSIEKKDTRSAEPSASGTPQEGNDG